MREISLAVVLLLAVYSQGKTEDTLLGTNSAHDIVLAHFAFDSGTGAFRTSTSSELHFEGEHDTDIVHWLKVNGVKKFTYTWNIFVVGECRMEEFEGNMAWHVTNNKGAAGQRQKPCKIQTKVPLDIPAGYSQCSFELLVKDVDYHGASKDEEDFVCLKATNRWGVEIQGSKACLHNDIAGYERRLLEYDRVMSNNAEGKQYLRADHTVNGNLAGLTHAGEHRRSKALAVDQVATIEEQDEVLHHTESHEKFWYNERMRGEKDSSKTLHTQFGTNNANPTNIKQRVLRSAYVPAKLLKYGVKVEIEASTDHNFEHWYTDDIIIRCTPTGMAHFKLTFESTSAVLEAAIRKTLTKMFHVERWAVDVAALEEAPTTGSTSQAHLGVSVIFLQFNELEAARELLSLSDSGVFLNSLEAGLELENFKSTINFLIKASEQTVQSTEHFRHDHSRGEREREIKKHVSL